ncbi:ABC transporter ATP-binding protein [Emcibacter nanhaiensis]|uniref:ABC transporter ATP-binding protein n=1 Tax=Emcibacter nanhaiensis TaxID=1505037 RepID=A0A501PST0_9PROT|nr:ABC transporter ATP-binding protein [Emcibacter nanhaiensis]TPD63014.1 ABC transporter ATP-binding protein [Emcibacter nanhaiensis]
MAGPGTPTAASPLISCMELHRHYQLGDSVVRALDGVTTSIDEGEYVAIMGASGSGKSTFMNMIGMLDVPDSGELSIDGRRVGELTSDELARLRNERIGFVFQQFNLLSRATALDNVKLPLLYSPMASSEMTPRAMECLRLVGLEERAGHLPSQLSGGQQQRVAIARALANRPKILLADEPTGALDSKTSRDIMELFTRLNDQGITVIIVTHEQEVADYARRQLVFRDGKIIHDSAAEGEAA